MLPLLLQCHHSMQMCQLLSVCLCKVNKISYSAFSHFSWFISLQESFSKFQWNFPCYFWTLAHVGCPNLKLVMYALSQCVTIYKSYLRNYGHSLDPTNTSQQHRQLLKVSYDVKHAIFETILADVALQGVIHPILAAISTPSTSIYAVLTFLMKQYDCFPKSFTNLLAPIWKHSPPIVPCRTCLW